MSTFQLAKMLLRCLLMSLFSLHVLLAASPTATTTTTNNFYNCSRNYSLMVGNSPPQPSSIDPATRRCTEENTSRTSSCVLSSQDGFQRCRSSLSEILAQNNGEISSGDCLLLELEQGEYLISSLSTVSVNFSLVLVAVDSGEVTVSCSGHGSTQPASSMQPNPSCATGGPTVPLMFGRKEGERGELAVVLLRGIKFQDCPRPLQFDDLDRVTITNCWFR